MDETMWDRLTEWAADIHCPMCRHDGLIVNRTVVPNDLGTLTPSGMQPRFSAVEKPVLACPADTCDFEARGRPVGA